MDPNTVLVTGGTGLLGRQVVKAFERAGWNTVSTGFSRADPRKILKCDLCDSNAVQKTLQDVRPQIVIHCAAERFPDRVEANPEGARQLNIQAAKELAQHCQNINAFIIYISTDYVFPGTPGDAPYAANAAPAPTNLYGQTKLDGETAILEVTKSTGLGLVLRVPVLYGAVEPAGNNKESAVNVLLDAVHKAEKGEKVVMDDWSIRYPTNTEDVGRICKDLSTELIEAHAQGSHQELPKIFQFSSEDRFTKYEICELLAEVLGVTIPGMVANKEGNDPNAAVQRPYDCHLSTQDLKDIGIDVVTSDFKAWWRWQFKAVRR